MEGPDSSYSCLEIHICWKVEREARMEPPIQTEYLRSGGAMILTFMEDGASAVISFCMRSEIPGYMVVPPDWDKLAKGQLGSKGDTHHDDVAVEILADVDVALHNGVEGGDVDAAGSRDPGQKAGTAPRGHGSARCRW